ncbi:DUF3328 domain containing protein [Pyrenophora tritici-repentis]|nr:DUF3328 domain containing protein [Pyrenophora tritici-repentis]
MSPFNYTKVSSESSQPESLEQQPSKQIPGRLSGGAQDCPYHNAEENVPHRQEICIRPPNHSFYQRHKAPMDGSHAPRRRFPPSPRLYLAHPTSPHALLRHPGKQVYAIAVFHELHCLMHLSGYIDKLVMQIRNRDFELDEGAVWHNDHCFNYLRNALLCCGDTTLEGQAQTPELQGVAGTDGTGAVHVCRNYDEILAFAEKVRLTDAKEHF